MLIAKRLGRGRLAWPPIVDGALVLMPAQLSLLIAGMDWLTVMADPPPRPSYA